MIVSFVAPSQAVPMGGVTAIYDFANGLARRGHEVHIAHGRFWGRGITSLDEIAWFDFESGIHHHLDPGTGVDLPDGDIIFGTEAPRRMGLPVLLVQGLDMFPKEMEHQAFRTPGLKVCVASWLIDAGLELGVPRERSSTCRWGSITGSSASAPRSRTVPRAWASSITSTWPRDGGPAWPPSSWSTSGCPRPR